MATPLATLGVLSIGTLLVMLANTHARAKSASIELVSTDEELAAASDYIISIVPPRDAMATAERILGASRAESFSKRDVPLYYMDMNAASPKLIRTMSELFETAGNSIRFIDGAVIGSAPSLIAEATDSSNLESWKRPSFPMSGPYQLADAERSGAHLASVLEARHISDQIGAASGLKMSFAALTKGFTGLAIQSFTTAHRLGVLPELQKHLQQYSPKTFDLANASMPRMPPKAYRWVREMEEIGATLAEDGGFEDEEAIFSGIARTYDLVAYGTDLGKEKTEVRSRGKTAEDVAILMSEGIDRRKQKTD
ncbi:6-phosphogluconate dehydrogenase C-terminal domain-like protein [Aureobasidium subglaciale]|nr:6-phosphogluconate dehydrogenase C-terminal domain-like protein [Aureobasidium subglaciale]